MNNRLNNIHHTTLELVKKRAWEHCQDIDYDKMAIRLTKEGWDILDNFRPITRNRDGSIAPFHQQINDRIEMLQYNEKCAEETAVWLAERCYVLPSYRPTRLKYPRVRQGLLRNILL